MFMLENTDDLSKTEICICGYDISIRSKPDVTVLKEVVTCLQSKPTLSFHVGDEINML